MQILKQSLKPHVIRKTMLIEELLKYPKIYRFFVSGIAKKKQNFYSILSEYLKKNYPSRTIVDIGCGDAEIASYFNRKTKYVGIDISEKYIESARKKYPYFEFYHYDITKNKILSFTNCVFLLLGVIHHLDDENSKNLINQLKSNDGSVIICLDGVKVKNQHPISKLLMKMDRGKFIRPKSEYEKIFVDFKFFMRDDLLYLPYNHIISVYNTKIDLF